MKKEAGLMLRIDSLAANQQPEKAVVSAEGIKALFIVPGAPFGCGKSFDIKVPIHSKCLSLSLHLKTL